MDAVAETTRFDFDRVLEMPVMDTLGYAGYINWKRRREQARIDKETGKIRIA